MRWRDAGDGNSWVEGVIVGEQSDKKHGRESISTEYRRLISEMLWSTALWSSSRGVHICCQLAECGCNVDPSDYIQLFSSNFDEKRVNHSSLGEQLQRLSSVTLSSPASPRFLFLYHVKLNVITVNAVSCYVVYLRGICCSGLWLQLWKWTYGISCFFSKLNTSITQVFVLWVHVCFRFLHSSFRRNLKTLLLNQAVSLQSPCLSKEKLGVSSNRISAATDNLRPNSWSRVALPGATERDRLIPECNPVARGFWQIHYTTLSLPPTEEQAVNKGWYKPDVSQFCLLGCRWRWWMSSSLCSYVWALGYALLGLWQRGQRQNWGAGISLSQSARPLMERNGNIWDITSDWQSIPPWESTGQCQQIYVCDGRKSACNGLTSL